MTDVLVVRPSSLGDVVHAMPIVADIAHYLPGSNVDWIAEEAFAPLVRLNPGIRRVVQVSLRRWLGHLLERQAWSEFAQFRSEVRQHRYDAVLDLQEQVKGAMMARLAHGVRHGFDRSTVREPASTFLHDIHHAVPISMHFQDRCRTLAGKALGYEPRGPARYGLVAPLPPAGLLPASRYAVCVHATSRDDKLWPEPHWHALLAALGMAGLTALLPWGSEEERTRSDRLAGPHPRAIVPDRQSLPLVAALLRGAQFVVGVDTGLVHLAAALGTPTVALFTVTDPALAGVAIVGTHAVDLGGRGEVPSADAVLGNVAAILRDMPRC